MKRISSLLIAVILACVCALMFTGCNNNNGKTVIRLSEVTHSIFYAPLYIAINNGYFDEENIKIELSNGDGANNVMTALITNAADIGLMGPEATVYVQAEGLNNYPVIFGQLTKRDGSFLVGRTNEGENFDWANLGGKKILAGRKGGVPAMTLQYVLNQAGVDTDTPLFDTTVQFGAMIGTFKTDSSYDYCTMFEPACSDFLAENPNFYVVASVGQDSGEVPYTAFSATKNYLNNNRDTAKAFLRAIMKGYSFLTQNDSQTVAQALEASFNGTSVSSIKASIESYVAIDAWNQTPVMTADAFNRLQDIMINADELASRISFNNAVDNSLANELLAELVA